jgi:DNA replication and repair protein RecF
MIDDVSMSLDEKRCSRLLDQLASLGQVFLTTTDVHLTHSFSGAKKKISLPLEISFECLSGESR